MTDFDTWPQPGPAIGGTHAMKSRKPQEADPNARRALPRQRRALLVADVVESVRLVRDYPDDVIALWVDFVRDVRDRLLERHHGTMVKSLGDGLLMGFERSTDAIRCALALGDMLRPRNSRLPAEGRIWLRCGVHIGDVVVTELDWFGDAVNIASRVASLAGPGEIVATADVRDELVDGVDVTIEDMGECFVKHLNEPLRACRLTAAKPTPVRFEPPKRTGDEALQPVVCVMPFAGEPAQDSATLGDLLAADVHVELSRLAGLHVISKLSANAMAGRQATLDELRHHLGAHYVISGSCRLMGSRVRLTSEIAETRTGFVIWSDGMQVPASDILSGRCEAVARIAAEATRAIIDRELRYGGSMPIHSIENYALLLNGVQLLHRNSSSCFDRARDLLQALADRLPRHPAPRAWLAKWYVLGLQQGWSADPAESARKAEDHCHRALDIDGANSLALTVEGLVQVHFHKRLELGERCYAQALEANPNEPLAWANKGMMHAFRGEGELAVAATQQALKLAPLDPLRYYYDTLAASASASAQRYEEAIELARRSLRANSMHTSTLRVLAIAHQMLGQDEAARAAVTRLLALEPGFNLDRFRTRGPGAHSAMGKVFAEALAQAGVPE
jgi:adenylate cyclase